MKKTILPLLLLGLALLSFTTHFDIKIAEEMQNYQNIPIITEIMHGFSFIGSSTFLIPLNLLLLLLFLSKGRKKILPVSLGTLGVWCLNALIKAVVKRPRPPFIHLAKETSYSFPSGHAMSNGCFFLLLAHFFEEEFEVNLYPYAYGMIFFISISRVYLGVHYLSDVLAGAGLGILLANLITNTFIRKT